MDPNTDPAFIAELGDYRLVKLIGSGAFGEVFLARDSSGAECVLKLMKKKSSMDAVWNARAFEQEARTLRLIANNYQGHYIVKLLNYVRTLFGLDTLYMSRKDSLFVIVSEFDSFLTYFHLSFRLSSTKEKP